MLDKFKIKKQHFHGGAMNGVCCRRLLDNVDSIFEKIRSLTVERLKTHVGRNIKHDIKVLTDKIEEFHYLFEITDIVFSHLRILSPTEDEIKETGKAIEMLENMWNY